MQNIRNLHKNVFLVRASILIIVFFSLLCGMKAFAYPHSEQYKIAYLMDEIGSSNLVFVRNEVEYNGEQAKAHLQHKMDSAGGLIVTADDFINYIASESLTSGTPYYVQLDDGTRIESGIWLRAKLAEIK